MVVDERDGDPVVAGAFGEREGQDQDADEQGPPVQPAAGAVALGWPSGFGGGVFVIGEERSGREQDGDRGDDGHDGQVSRDGHTDRDQPGAQECTAHRADAVAGVEAGHDRPPGVPFHQGALDVHGHVPGGQPESHKEQPQDDRRGPGVVAHPDHRQSASGDHRHHRDHHAGAEAADQYRGGRERQQGPDCQRQQHDP